MPDWITSGLKDGIAAFFPSAALLLALTWLLRTYIAQKLKTDAALYKLRFESEEKRRFEEFKVELEHKTDREIEKLKSALTIEAYREQMRIKSLQEKQASVIRKLYSYAAVISSLMQSGIRGKEGSMFSGITEHFKRISEAHKQLNAYYSAHRYIKQPTLP